MRKFKIGVIGAGMRVMFLMNEILEREELQQPFKQENMCF